MSDDKPMPFHKIMKMAKNAGMIDPEVECETHNFKCRLSQLAPMALLALQEGIDIQGDECILAKDLKPYGT